MKFPASGGGDFDPLAEGVHIGVCDMIVDLGVQPGRGAFGPKHEVYIRWQVPAERVTYTKDGKELEGPRVVGQSYTASMSPKANLRKIIEAWFGKKFPGDKEAEDFDIAKLLGRACQVQVAHSKDGKYANVVSVMALPKGLPAPAVENGTLLYDTEHDATYAKLPQWLQKKVDGQIYDQQPPANPTKTTPMNTTSSASTTSSSRSPSADAEAARIAAQQAERRSASGQALDNFEDSEIPF